VVAVRISRESIEVGAEAPATAGVTRLDAEVAILAKETGTGRAAVSRVSIEVLARNPPVASVTRLDAEVAVLAKETGTGRAAISRESIEVGARVIKRASVTRLDSEVAILAKEASTDDVRVTRLSWEALAHRSASGRIEPLALADGIEVFLHNWVDEAVLSTRYMTDVSVSPNSGAESRRGLMLKPERTLSLLWQIHANDSTLLNRFDRLLVMLRKLTDERIAVPLYMDQRELAAAYSLSASTVFLNTSQGRWFTGARVVIVQLNYQGGYGSHSFHIIESMEDDRLNFEDPIGVNVAAGSLIIPMIDCEVILEAKGKYETARNIAVKLELMEVAGASQLPPVRSDTPAETPTHDDIPIFDYDPDWVGGIEKGRVRDGQKYGQGITSRVYRAATRSKEWHKLDMTGLRSCSSAPRDDIWRVVEFFDSRRGRLRTFWHIDQEQLWTVDGIDAGGAFVGIDQFGDFSDFEAELEGGWIGLVMSDGTFYVREAVTVQQVLTVYRITVNPALPAGLNAADVVRVARARRSRFDKDELEEHWKHTGYMATNVEIIETLEETDVET